MGCESLRLEIFVSAFLCYNYLKLSFLPSVSVLVPSRSPKTCGWWSLISLIAPCDDEERSLLGLPCLGWSRPLRLLRGTVLASTLCAYLLALGHQGQYGEDGQHMASLIQTPGRAACWGEATSASLAYGHLMGWERGFWKHRSRLPQGWVWNEKCLSFKNICYTFNQLTECTLGQIAHAQIRCEINYNYTTNAADWKTQFAENSYKFLMCYNKINKIITKHNNMIQILNTPLLCITIVLSLY